MLTALAVLGGFGLDLLLADPAWMPHPVVLMGKVIARLENLLWRPGGCWRRCCLWAPLP